MKMILAWTTLLLPIVCVSQDDNRTIRIPVIFHVLYADSSADNGIDCYSIVNGNSSQFIPTYKLLEELKNLHDDFLLLNSDTNQVNQAYKNIIGNPNIEFYLADTILQKQGEKGIIRVHTKRNHYRQMVSSSPAIDVHKYLNVYIGQLHSGAGSTNLPSDDTSSYNPNDVIRLDYKWVGLGTRLLTHEAGHWLGLEHIFGGSGSGSGDSKSCTEGDSIADTHPQKNPTDGDCIYCPPKCEDKSCDEQPSNYNNYMDYSGCRRMFTRGQAQKMRQVVREKRPKLWRNSVS